MVFMVLHSYKMGISLAYIAEQLSFDNLKSLRKFLREHGISITINKDGMWDTKSALPVLLAQSKNYSKVDIKGQI